MNEFIQYTENKKFVRWVLEPNEELDSYWGQYKKDNPDELGQIEEARIIVLQLKSKKEDVTEKETDILFSEIMEGVNSAQNKKEPRAIVLSFVKYAAAVVFLIALGVGYYSYKKNTEFTHTAQRLIAKTNLRSGNSQLILSNGENLTLKTRNSSIEYLSARELVVDNEDTIQIQDLGRKDFNQLLVPRGNTSTIKFYDGSVVHVNAASQLVYPAIFKEGTRQVYLVGEGFFEVEHNPELPFIASTSNIEVEVLGTKFNISAYPAEDVIETFLLEGSVDIKGTAARRAQEDYVLNPLQSATFNKANKKIEVVDVNDSEYVSWYNGYLSFNSKSLSCIVKNLERYFDVEIKLSSPELSYILISGKLKIKDEGIDTVLQVLVNTSSLELEKLEDSVYLLK